MIHTSIIIPTCKSLKDITDLIDEIQAYTDMTHCELIRTCQNASAACNRNMGLKLSQCGNIIMIDDDIMGLFFGWADMLIETLHKANVILVSARLLHPEGHMGIMMDIVPDLARDIQIIKSGLVPAACVAFIKDKIRFDEKYEGGGWEDNDFCMQMNQRYGNEGLVVIDNRVRLVHLNERKNQILMGKNFDYYKQKWGIR